MTYFYFAMGRAIILRVFPLKDDKEANEQLTDHPQHTTTSTTAVLSFALQTQIPPYIHDAKHRPAPHRTAIQLAIVDAHYCTAFPCLSSRIQSIPPLSAKNQSPTAPPPAAHRLGTIPCSPQPSSASRRRAKSSISQ